MIHRKQRVPMRDLSTMSAEDREAVEKTPLSPDAELVAYRVAQEALTNAVRHAGADGAHVRLGADGDGVELVVSDDGVGVSPAAAEDSAGGIRGMRERALLIGGRLEVAPAPGGGTAVRLHVPRPE